MAEMLPVALTVTAAALIGAVLVAWLIARRRARGNTPAALTSPSLEQLRGGDRVRYLGTTYRVQDREERSGGARRWIEYTLRDLDKRYWLRIQLEPRRRVTLCDEVELEQLPDTLPEVIEHNGVSYRREDTAAQGQPQDQETQLTTYLAADGRWLFVDPPPSTDDAEAEIRRRTRVGRDIEPEALTVLAGS